MSLNIEFTSTLPTGATIVAASVATPEAASVTEPEVEISLAQLIITFANGISATLYQQWHTCAHKYGMELREVLEEAMKAHFKAKLTPKDKLPPRKQAKVDKKIQVEREKLREKWM